MSTQSPQEKAAGEQMQWQADLAQRLYGLSGPEFGRIMGSRGLGGMLASVDSSGMMGIDRANYGAALSELNTDYGRAGRVSNEAISYGALRGGEGRRAPMAMNSAITTAATGLERDQAAAQRNLAFQSAQASMGDFNKVLSLLGQGSQSSLGLAGGFAGATGSAIAGLSRNSQFGSTLGGAAAGASLGTQINPGWGTLIGGVAGGAAGYLGYGG